jgi:hypothetical protein
MSKERKPIRVRIYEHNVSKYECATEHDAFMYMMRAQPHSVCYAVTENGWDVFVDYEDETIKWNEEYYGI